MSNDEFAQHLSHMEGTIKLFPVTIKEIIDSVSTNQVIIWATSEILWSDGIVGEGEDWTFKGEYMFVLDFVEQDGEWKIQRVLEFLDSAVSQKLGGLMRKAKERLGLKVEGWAASS